MTTYIFYIIAKLSWGLLYIGAALFIAWAYRDLNKKQLKKLVIIVLILGVLGVLATSFCDKKGWNNGKDHYWKEKKETMFNIEFEEKPRDLGTIILDEKNTGN